MGALYQWQVQWRRSGRKQEQENETGVEGRYPVVSHYMTRPGRQRRPLLRMRCKRSR